VETVVGPEGVRCQTTVTGPSAAIPSAGGAASVSVSAARDCTWTAASEVSWMQLNSTSGQGNGTLAVTVARNESPAARNGSIAVNGQRVTVSQEGRPCTYDLRASPQNFSSEGGRGTVSIDTSAGCSWTASSSATWLSVLTPSGSGAGAVELDAAINNGGPRDATITINGQAVTITQDARGQSGGGGGTACHVMLSSSVVNAAAAGGTHTVTLATMQQCDWTATTSAPSWLTVAPTSGRGDASLTLTVARNTGNSRSATLTAGDQTATVNQAAAPACTVAIDPASANFPAGGGDGRIRVTTQDGCDWAMTGGAQWTQITNARGTGNGEARYVVTANTATAARSTTLSIGGRSHSVTQEAAAPTCTYSIDPPARNFTAAGGDGTVTVNTQAGCQWSTTGVPGWITVNNGQGSGPGQVSYTVQANSSAARSGSISVGGQTHAVTQESGAPTCTYTLTPTSQNFPAGGGPAQFTVDTQAGCSWSASVASSGMSWVTVTSGSGSGRGQVSFSVQSNSAATPRQTTITVDGQSFGITQEATAPTCTYTLAPTSQTVAAGGDSGQFTVDTQAGCSWNASVASGGASWVTLTSGSGSGRGQVSFSVQANSATSSRQTTIAVGGQSFTITQEAAAPTCTYTLPVTSQNFTATGGNGQFSINTQSGCSWNASSGAFWVTTSSTGSGSGNVSYSVQSNSGAARQTTITVGGQSFTVTQEAAAPTCTYTLAPTSQNFAAAGGSFQFSVTTQAGCSWTASSSALWITGTTPSGSGPGSVSYTVQANASGAQRQATITVNGQSHTVTQAP
jgi:hypothetical protein